MEEDNQTSKSKMYILDLNITSDEENIKNERLPWASRTMRRNFCGTKNFTDE